MNAGILDRYISIRQWDTSIDDIGGLIEGWSHFAYAWARKLPENGREFIAAQTRIAEAAAVIRLWYREDIKSTWRIYMDGVLYEVAAPPIEVGRRNQIDLILKSVPDTEVTAPISNIFDVVLRQGDVGKTIKYPLPFASDPAMVDVQLVVPAGGETFEVTIASQDEEGLVVEFSAVVPASGYKLSISAFQYTTVMTLDLEVGEPELDVVFSPAFPRAPRGIKVELIEPEGGYTFTNAIQVGSLTANGCTILLGANTPDVGYKVLVKVSL